MSRRRIRPITELPEELQSFRPEEWSTDPGDLLDWWYYGRHRWTQARQEWAEQQGCTPSMLARAGGLDAWLSQGL